MNMARQPIHSCCMHISIALLLQIDANGKHRKEQWIKRSKHIQRSHMKGQFLVNIFRLCAFFLAIHTMFWWNWRNYQQYKTEETAYLGRRWYLQGHNACKLSHCLYKNYLAYIDAISMEPPNLNGQSANWKPSWRCPQRNSQLLNAMPIVNTMIQMIIKLFPKSRLYLNKKFSCNQKGFHTLMELTRSGYIVVKNSWLIPKDEISNG